ICKARTGRGPSLVEALTYRHGGLSLVVFQAEDGIRDATVTGVQTCALPIFPIERRRAVVGQHLAGELGVDAFGELPRLIQVRLRGFAPEHLDVGRIGQAASDGGLQPAAELEEALYGSRAFDELPVTRIGVAEQQA